jgi:hypothetical protein
MAGKGVRELVRRAMSGGKTVGHRPWSVQVERSAERGMVFTLRHYGTNMLQWDLNKDILGTWTGWGSVSDQTGVNAALDAIGSNLRYSRDTRGGGPRINPFRVGSMVGGMLRSASPAVYNPGMVFPPRLSYNARRRKRR